MPSCPLTYQGREVYYSTWIRDRLWSDTHLDRFSLWCRYTEFIRSGSVLLANPAVFLKNNRPELAQRFFLPTEMPPLAGANIDNVANLLPVVFLLSESMSCDS